jgi:hypothetical protein
MGVRSNGCAFFVILFDLEGHVVRWVYFVYVMNVVARKV